MQDKMQETPTPRFKCDFFCLSLVSLIILLLLLIFYY